MLTWQDYLKATDKIEFITKAISEYQSSPDYLIAVDADQYEKQRNTTITRFVHWFYKASGQPIVDTTASNNHIASNFFHILNRDRCTYSLGNGVTFANDRDGGTDTKGKLGNDFDTVLYSAAFDALEHGVSYLFWNLDRVYEFKMTEFCPLFDEETGALRAGIRFWSVEWNKKPVQVRLYTEDGVTAFRTREGSSGLDLVMLEEQKPYKIKVAANAADGEVIVGGSNYPSLPIVPLYGSSRKQSTLVGVKESIDAYDLICSGFANDLEDCAEAYWIISDAMGMQPKDIQRFREQLKFFHVGVADSETPVTPYTQPIPTEARMNFLETIRQQLFRDFSVLDVTTVSAEAKTATEIDAAYQPMDAEADNFEYQIITAVRQLLALQGIDDVPQFKRNRVVSQKEITEMVMMAADYLDRETILRKLTFIDVDEIEKILQNTDAESVSGMPTMKQLQEAMNE